MRRRSRE